MIRTIIACKNKMTDEDYLKLDKAAMNGTLSDDHNPVFLFSQTSTTLLIDYKNGNLDIEFLINKELQHRNLV